MSQLDELVVRIRGETSQFRRSMSGVADSATKTARGVRARFSAMTATARRFGSQIFSVQGLVLGLATGAMARLVKSTLDSSDELVKLSRNVGFSAERLQELSFAASQTGASQEALNSGIERFSRRLAFAVEGNEQYARTFRNLGIETTDVNGKIRNAEDVFNEFADAMKNTENEAEANGAAFRIFGNSATQLIGTLRQGSSGLDDYAKQARELGLVIDSDLLEGAEDANDQLDIMARTIRSEVTRAVLDLAPEIQSLAQGITNLTRTAIEFISFMSEGDTAQKRFDSLGREIEKVENQITDVKRAAELGIYGTAVADTEALEEKLKSLREEQSRVLDEVLESEGVWEKAEEAASKANTSNKETSNEATMALRKQIEAQQQLAEEAAKIVSSTTGESDEERLEREIEILRDANSQKLGAEEELNAAIREKEQELFDFKRDKRREELEALEERNELLKEMDEERFEEEIEANQERIEALMAQEDELSNYAIQKRIEERKAKEEENERELRARQELNEATIAGARETSENMVTLAQGRNRQIFEVSKKASVATAIIQGFQAVQNTLASIPFPANIAAAASVATQTAVNVDRMQGVGFRKGVDSVPGIGTQDNFPAILAPRERVVQAEANKDLTEFLRKQKEGAGSGQNITNEFHFHGPLVGTGREIIAMINRETRKTGARVLDGNNN